MISEDKVANALTGFITKSTLANLGTCATLCSLFTEAFKFVIPMHPLLISLFVATLLSIAKYLVSDKHTIENALLALLNIIPIALTSNGCYDICKKTFF